MDIYQTGAGSSMTLEYRLLRGAAPAPLGPSVGQIVLGGARRVTALELPLNAGMITTGAADQSSDRVVTFVFRGEI